MRADRFSLTSTLAEVRNQFAIIADVGFLDAAAPRKIDPWHCYRSALERAHFRIWIVFVR
jgi:hypothetical protein